MNIESVLLKDLFDRLNKSDIPYAVLRNYESLPHSLNGSDLDILVAASDALAAKSAFETFARSHGGRLISVYSVKTHILRFCGRRDSIWWGLPVDIYTSLEYRGLEYANSDNVLSEAEKFEGVRVVSKSDAGIIAFLKECLANGCSRKNYMEEAAEACAKNKERYSLMLSYYLGTQAALKFFNYLMSNRNAKELRALSAMLRRSLYFTTLRRKTIQSIQSILGVYLRRFPRLISPPGYTVAVLGTDGSGKSTVIANIDAILSKALHSKVQYEHMRPNVLPCIARLFGRPGTSGPVTNPHASKPSGFLGSLVRLLYYSLDYIFGYWIKIYPSLVKRPTLYVFDRYYYDYLIDPRRSRVCLPKWIVEGIGLFIPQPALILCLGTDPAVIHARKPELPLDEVERQVTKLKRFCKENIRAVWIDTGCPIEESVDKALDAITSRMAARYEK